MTDRNDMSYWFPPLVTAGVPVPRTVLVRTELDLMALLDGETPEGFDVFMRQLLAALPEVGWPYGPAFLRTGHGSAKHGWRDTCLIPNDGYDDPIRRVLERHVARLVEWSALVDLMGLPTGTWAMRELLNTRPLFVCEGYKGFPVVREFRVFIRGDAVEHVQPYWPPDACEQGEPDSPIWRERLEWASKLADGEDEQVAFLAGQAAGAVGDEGYWSVDMLQDRHGKWWVTDMADGDQSFRWEPDA